MNKKTWYIIVGIVIVALIIFEINAKNKDTNKDNSSNNDQNTEQTQQPSQSSNNNNPEQTPTMQNGSTVWEGNLQLSDSPAKGNLMLKTDKSTIYINTGRDYSSLIGKDVKVTYKGTLDSFGLEDITAK